MDKAAFITSPQLEDVKAMDARKPLQLLALNHVSRVCSDLAASYRFYTEVLGFTPVKRPTSFSFEGAWLHNYGIGLHLIKGCPPPRPAKINPKSCHISFQAASLAEVEESLGRLDIPFVKNVFVEDGVQVSQLFFHDPDNNMIEICNCDVLPVVPLKDDPMATAEPWAESLADANAAQLRCNSASDAGSDVDSGLHEAFEAASLISEVAAPHRSAGGDSECEGAADTRDPYPHQLPHLLNDDFSSFSSMAMSSVIMANPMSMMSIAPPELDDWPHLEFTGASVSGGSQSEFVMELKHRLSRV